MKHHGKAAAAARRILLIAVIAFGILATLLIVVGVPLGMALGCEGILLLLAVAFTLYFFRDPEANVPADPKAIVAPAHGKVDVIDETDESQVMGGRCRRISIFLSVFDVHVQQSPVSGKVTYLKHTPGAFMNALKTECADHNENVLIGIQSTQPAADRIAVRLIAGLIARRILPWLKIDESISKGERISLIQFGSRVNLYLPMAANIEIHLGDRVVGGETIVARLP